MFKPTLVTISPIFLLLVIYVAGNAWASCLPKGTHNARTRLAFLSPFFGFINPGPFTLKEVHPTTNYVVGHSTKIRTTTACCGFSGGCHSVSSQYRSVELRHSKGHLAALVVYADSDRCIVILRHAGRNSDSRPDYVLNCMLRVRIPSVFGQYFTQRV